MLVIGVDGINGEYEPGSGELPMHSQNESIADFDSNTQNPRTYHVH